MTFFVVLFLLLMQFLWRYIDELVGKGLELKIIGELLFYASSGLVPLALPLAVLLSSLMTFGNMGEYYELTAIKSSGISLRRIMLPLVVLVFFISIGAFLFANNILPYTNLKMKSLLYDVRNQRPEVQIMEGVFYNGIDNFSIRVNRKDPETNMMYGIRIYDHTASKGNVSVTLADSGRMKMTADRRNLVVTLWSGRSYSEMDEKRKRDRNYPHRLDKFKEQRIIIEMSGFELLRSDESLFRNSYTMLNLSQLQSARDSLENELNKKSRQFYNTMIMNNFFKMSMYKRRNLPPTAIHLDPNTPVAPSSPGAVNPSTAKRTSVRELPIQKKQALEAAREKAAQEAPVAPPVTYTAGKPVLKVHDFDSLFSTYSIEKQHEIVRYAITSTSMNQYSVVSTASNLTYDMRYLRRHEIEWHRKFTLSIACLIFLFIGAPLGAIIRKGGLGMPTVISTLMFILYYIISLTGEKFVRESVLSATAGMWLSSYILIIAGIFLTYEATNDSAILNLDSYINWFRDKLGFSRKVILDRKTHLTGKFELLDIPRAELQREFNALGKQAGVCMNQMGKDVTFKSLFKKTITNTGYLYLIELGIDYNSLIDRIILSKWFRHPYFYKRLSEFPYLNGRITANYFPKRFIKVASYIFFPVWLFILLHLWLKSRRLKRNLQQVAALSAGMVNLLNSSAIKTEAEFLT